MTTSGTYLFSPSVADLVFIAYARVGVRRPAVTPEHLTDARIESNLLLQEFNNRGVNLWTVDLQSVALVQGQASYTVPSTTITVLDAYVTVGTGQQAYDRIISPLSRSDYAALPNKALQGLPTSYWFDRLETPTMNLWEVPNNGGPYTLNYYRYRQVQDSVLAGGLTPDMPLRWVDAFTAALSARLARMHAPAVLAEAKQEAERTWLIAAAQDTEDAPFGILPMVGAYYGNN